MAVFRVERNKGYTVMSNHHLRNKELSLRPFCTLRAGRQRPLRRNCFDYTSPKSRDCGGVVQFYAVITGMFIMRRKVVDRYLSVLQEEATIRNGVRMQ